MKVVLERTSAARRCSKEQTQEETGAAMFAEQLKSPSSVDSEFYRLHHCHHSPVFVLSGASAHVLVPPPPICQCGSVSLTSLLGAL